MTAEQDAEQPIHVVEGVRVVEEATRRGISVRLLGGVAIWLHCTPRTRAILGRDYADIDLVARRKQARGVRETLEALGYQPERAFNAKHGASRLLFHAEDGSQVDVFLDQFVMSHTLNFLPRLEVESPTLPAAELLLTKLQVAEINRKDLTDVTMLLLDHRIEPGEDGLGRLNASPIVELCRDDWGLQTTITDNLLKLGEVVPEVLTEPDDRATVDAHVARLRGLLEESPKSRRWRMRASVGRRVRWNQTPEEVIR